VTDPIDVYIKDIKIANAKAVVINNDYLGIKITEMVGEKKMDEPPCLEGPGADPNENK
jgi:hypothetical protein